MASSSTIILIPARYESSRFPGKPLALIHNRPMIDYVASHARETGQDYAVVTDHQGIEEVCQKYGHPCFRVDDETQSGSERLFLCYERFLKDKGYQWMINLQGDEPLMKASDLNEFVQELFATKSNIHTLVKKRSFYQEESQKHFENPNVVKAVLTQSGRCLYFSRSPIPFHRGLKRDYWLQHIGLYAYRLSSLDLIFSSFDSGLEKSEALEQLQFLEKDLDISASFYEGLGPIGVDAPEDICQVERFLQE